MVPWLAVIIVTFATYIFTWLSKVAVPDYPNWAKRAVAGIFALLLTAFQGTTLPADLYGPILSHFQPIVTAFVITLGSHILYHLLSWLQKWVPGT